MKIEVKRDRTNNMNFFNDKSDGKGQQGFKQTFSN